MFITFEKLNPGSRLWVYQANRLLHPDEEMSIRTSGQQFIEQWTSHNLNLVGSFEIINHLFLIIAVDESVQDAGGCSIDKSFGFIRKLEQDFSLVLLNRKALVYEKNGIMELTDLPAFEKLYREGHINENDLVYNTLINTKSQLLNEWKIPLKESWVMQVI